MKTTPVYGWPYAEGPDPAKQFPAAVDQPRTEAIEAALVARVPAGIIAAWAGATAPPGWALCNGALLRRDEQPGLFAAIGVAYGIGDGVTTFATPNLQGRVIVAAGGGFALNGAGGEINHVLTAGEMPSHQHALPAFLNNDWILNTPGNPSYVTGLNSFTGGGQVSAAAGGGAAHNNMQPYLVLNHIIKL